MILISLIFLILAEKMKKKELKLLMYILAVVPFFLVSILRYDVGTDYLKRYVYDYNRMAEGINVENFEIGFKLLIQICLIFTKSPNILFIVTSAIILGFIMTTIYKRSKNIILSVIIFFLGGFFFDSLNLVRQYVAMSIILFGYKFLIKDSKETDDANSIKSIRDIKSIKDIKRIKNLKYIVSYIVCVIIAVTMHSSSIVALLLVVLNKKEIMNWKWVIPVSVLILLLNEKLLGLLGLVLQNTRFNVYLTGNMARGEVSVLYILENFLVYIFMYYIYTKNKKTQKNGKEDTLLLNIQGLSLLITVCGACHMQFSRIALYFLIFQIISIPYYISVIPIEDVKEDLNKIFKGKINFEKVMPKLKQIVSALFIICLMGVFWYTNIKNNNNEVVPYKTIINKDISIG